MEINLKKLKELVDELSTGKSKNNSIDYDFWSRNSTGLIPNKKLTIDARLCLHRQNYRTILVDQSGWMYVQFLNLTESDSTGIRIEHLWKRIKIRAFNLVVEFLNPSEGPHLRIYYIQTDLNKCELRNNDIDWNLVPVDSLDSVKLTNELMIFYNLGKEVEFSHDCYFRVDSLGPVISTICSTQMRQLKAKLRADIKVELIDPKKPNAYCIISLLGKHLVYYSFLHIGRTYLLKSQSPLSTYLHICARGASGGESNKPVESILQFDDSMRILDTFETPNFLTKLVGGFQFEPKFDPNHEYIDRLTGLLIDKQIKTNSQLTNLHESNQQLVDHFSLIFPNREFKLVVRPLNCEQTIVVYFETRFSLYELGILPGMRITLMNLNKRPGDRIYKTSIYMNAAFDQGLNFLDLDPDPIDVGDSCIVGRKKASLYEDLTNMETIYDCFYRNYTASNLLNFSLDKQDEEDVKNIERLKLLFGFQGSGNQRRILAQLTKIYDLHIKISCHNCGRLSNACRCESPDSLKIELTTTMLVDDHTSVLKLVYSTSNFEPKITTQSNLFGRMGVGLIRTLSKYLAEINLPCIPIQLSNEGGFDFETKLFQSIQEKIGSMDVSINSSVLELNDPTNCFHLVKMDIYKAMYDYLYHTCIDKYFVFYIDSMDAENMKEMGKLSRVGAANSICPQNIKNYKPKNDYNHFLLGELNSNEQFKSTLQLRCSKFVPIDVDLSDS